MTTLHDARLIDDLAVPHRARHAYQKLLRAGPRLLPLVMANLNHEVAAVRTACARYLDHYLEPEALGDLLAMLEDPDHEVRVASLHALACDRCKEGACRPDERLVLPAAMRLMASDPHPHVRAMASEVVALSVHTRPEAEAALRATAEGDSSPAVRKKARWYLPGGPVWARTRPKPERISKRARAA